MERIALAREYRVEEWLRDAYVELTQKSPLDFEELRPAEPHSNSLDGNWEATSRDWETLAKILYLQTKVAASIMSFGGSGHYCSPCDTWFGVSYKCLCKCRILAMVDEAFRGELESLKENLEHVEHPLPSSKLPLSYLCPLKINLYSQQHRQRRTCYFLRRFKEEEERKKIVAYSL